MVARPQRGRHGPLWSLGVTIVRITKMPPLLERAIAIAVEAHHDQKDRYGRPYILHPLRVMARVKTDSARMVAVLHDRSTAGHGRL